MVKISWLRSLLGFSRTNIFECRRPEPVIISAEIIPFTCLKTTLTGDYSHTKTAWKKAKEYLKTNKLRENSAGHYTHLFIKTIDDIKRPSKWITEIYIPILPKNQEKEKTNE